MRMHLKPQARHSVTESQRWNFTNIPILPVVISQLYLSLISGISHAYSDISHTYICHISAISLEYLKCISDICQTYLRHIKIISQVYFGHISDISTPYQTNLRNISNVPQTYLRLISGIFKVANLR